jgi:hypothetical protein
MTCTAFSGSRRIAQGPLGEVALAVKAAAAADPQAQLLTFDDATGRVIDLDLRGSDAAVLARLVPAAAEDLPARSRGRPRLGVVAREVTLLPRQWDWLAAQPGGASQALRRLVDEARRRDEGARDARAAQETAYRFMAAMAGDLPGFEEATRALFAGDAARFDLHAAPWPADIRAHARQLAGFAR